MRHDLEVADEEFVGAAAAPIAGLAAGTLVFPFLLSLFLQLV